MQTQVKDMDFVAMREAWAQRIPIPDADRIRIAEEIDRARNPHNDPYHNVAPRRTESQIISDLVYLRADGILSRQYGTAYAEAMRQAGFEKCHWNQVYRRRS